MIELDHLWLDAHPLPSAGSDTDKDARGVVLAAGGSESVPGALLLTGEAALRSGAGKVQLATVDRAALLLGLQMPEAATFSLPTNANGELAGAAGTALAYRLDQCGALIVGPGMGPDADAAGLLEALIAHPPEQGSLLLDAAMIPAAQKFENHPSPWRERRVLTPHLGEMAELMGCAEADVTPELAGEAAERFGATVVLKSSETWIAEPGMEMLHYAGGGPGLATAGSGDVLAGIIGGMLARGASAFTAAGWGVWLHGEAGKRLAARDGPLGFLARELPPLVPALLAKRTAP